MGYLKDSYNMSIKPLLDFASPVITPIGNFLTSGSNYNPNESAASNFTTSFTTPSNLFDNTFMSDNMDLTYGGSEVPDMPIMPSDTALGPIYISNPQPSYLDDDTFMSDNMDLTYNSNEQINPAGVTSADGMMTEPAMYLYPGEAIGIDGVPYRPSAGVSTSNSGSSNGGGSTAVASAVPSAPVLRTRTFPFTSRTPSGSVYAPDLSAYNDSSLFNYAGPGGLAEYTYGQGLRTDGADYSIFGSPANIANPYFAGQFKEPQGPADAAINMPAVELPEGVQPVTPTEVSADVSMPAFNGITPRPPNSAGDLTYQQTIDEMGIFGPNNPPPSTLFPSPGQATANEQNTVAGNIAGTPDNSMMANQAAADLAMGNRLGFPNQVRDRTAEILAYAEQNDGNIDGVEITNLTQASEFENNLTDAQVDNLNARGLNIQKTEDSIFGSRRDGLLDYRNPVYSMSNDAFTIPFFPQENQSNVLSSGELNTLANRAQRNIFKADEIDIPTPPFRPEGVEGEDFYQDVTGNFFSMEDDLGTQPLGPNTRGSKGSIDIPSGPNVRGTRGNIDIPSGPNVRGTRGDTIPADIPAFLDYDITRDNANYEAAVNARDNQLRNQLDSRPAYERDRMEYLDNAYSAIDAKYAGSKTNASQQAELVEVLNANLDSFGNAAGRENAALAREQQDMRQANATPFVPSYAREIEGTDMGESLFQNVDPVVQPVIQKRGATNKEAREGQQSGRVRAPAPVPVTPANITSIFNPGPPSMNQVRPMVARTENNMTVPVMRDSALDRRYGGPMRFGR